MSERPLHSCKSAKKQRAASMRAALCFYRAYSRYFSIIVLNSSAVLGGVNFPILRSLCKIALGLL